VSPNLPNSSNPIFATPLMLLAPFLTVPGLRLAGINRRRQPAPPQDGYPVCGHGPKGQVGQKSLLGRPECHGRRGPFEQLSFIFSF
jgi:hypothetical protein